jgi:hypothetical protein
VERVKTGNMDKWMGYFVTIMEQDYPQLEQSSDDPATIEEKEKDFKTVLLGEVCQASYRIFQRFGNRKLYGKFPFFVDYYLEHYAEKCMMAHLYIISKKDKFIGRKARYFSLRYIELFVVNRDTSKMIEQNMKTLLEDYMIPLLAMSVHDAIEFNNNTGESIRKELSNDLQMSDNCPKVAAQHLLKELCSYIPEGHKTPVLLNDFLSVCVDHLNEFKADPTIDFRIKDAAVFAIYSIIDIIEKDQTLLEGLENLLTEHVLEDITSENEFLKARALLCYNKVTTNLVLEDDPKTRRLCELLCN